MLNETFKQIDKKDNNYCQLRMKGNDIRWLKKQGALEHLRFSVAGKK
jgi:hypothetical protein